MCMCVCVRESERERRIEKALIHSQHPLHVPYMCLTCPLHVPYMCERRIEKALILVLYLAISPIACAHSLALQSAFLIRICIGYIVSIIVCASLRHTAVTRVCVTLQLVRCKTWYDRYMNTDIIHTYIHTYINTCMHT